MKTVNAFGVEREDYEDFEIDDVPGIIKVVENRTIKAIHGDNMQYLRWMHDNLKKGYFHVGIVDPPYGISIGSRMLGAKNMEAHKNRGYETGSWDNEVPTEEYWYLLKYVCRNLIVWGGNYFSNFIPPGRCCLCMG